MKKTFLLIVCLSIFYPFTIYAEETESYSRETMADIMVTAKVAGMCGTLGRLMAFERSTKPTTENDFVKRFVNSEAARLGETPEDLTLKSNAWHWKAIRGD